MTPQRFRKIPVEVEAVQWDGTNNAEVRRFCQGNVEFPRPKKAAVYDKLHDAWIPFKLTDHIIRGIQDELYPCTNEVFEATYEPVEPTKEEGYYCDVCPHAVFLHNPDGTCGCGSDCAKVRKLLAPPGPCQCGHLKVQHHFSTKSCNVVRAEGECPCQRYEPVNLIQPDSSEVKCQCGHERELHNTAGGFCCEVSESKRVYCRCQRYEPVKP